MLFPSKNLIYFTFLLLTKFLIKNEFNIIYYFSDVFFIKFSIIYIKKEKYNIHKLLFFIVFM